MSLKVTWKKGMRLSTDIFDALDSSNEDNLRQSILMSSGGRMGLYTTPKPFELSVNISNNFLEVISLSCHGITKSGKLVDIEFDSNYNHTFDTRLVIPSANDSEAFILVVRIHDKEWREVNEMLSEQKYTFELVGENSIIDGDSLPIGCLVNQYGWRLDEIDFVPPCLYVSSHVKYMELIAKAQSILKKISEECIASPNCVAKQLISIIWPAASSAAFSLDKEWETLTPNQFYSIVQQFINSFLIGCSMDHYINLENKDPFMMYVRRPFDNRNVYQSISKGLDLCAEIAIKMENVCTMTDVREEPVIAEKIQPKVPISKPEPQIPTRNRWEGIEI